MYRTRDLLGLKVFNKEGKSLGSVCDLSLDYFNSKVRGFLVSKKIFSKRNYVDLNNIISLSNTVMTKELYAHRGLKFSEIKNLKVLNKEGQLLGILDDLLIDCDFSIKGIIIVEGFFEKFKNGKKIISIKESILGEKTILFLGDEKVSMRMLPRKKLF